MKPPIKTLNKDEHLGSFSDGSFDQLYETVSYIAGRKSEFDRIDIEMTDCGCSRYDDCMCENGLEFYGRLTIKNPNYQEELAEFEAWKKAKKEQEKFLAQKQAQQEMAQLGVALLKEEQRYNRIKMRQQNHPNDPFLLKGEADSLAKLGDLKQKLLKLKKSLKTWHFSKFQAK